MEDIEIIPKIFANHNPLLWTLKTKRHSILGDLPMNFGEIQS